MSSQNRKKNLPITVLKALEPFVGLESRLFQVLDPGECLLHVKDIEDESSFYFKIGGFELKKGKIVLDFDYRPANFNMLGSRGGFIDPKDIKIYFDSWVKLLEEYDKVSTFYDDPILNSYEEGYYNEYKIIDEKADKEPFDPAYVLVLDEYFENMDISLQPYISEENNAWAVAIQEDILEVRNNLTQKPKNWIIRKMARIYAKFTKQGVPLLKEFVIEGKKELIKKGVKWIIAEGTNLLS